MSFPDAKMRLSPHRLESLGNHEGVGAFVFRRPSYFENVNRCNIAYKSHYQEFCRTVRVLVNNTPKYISDSDLGLLRFMYW